MFISGSKELIQFAEEFPSCHFFLDEVYVDDNKISSETILKISNIISESSYLWISCQSDKLPNLNDKFLDGMLLFLT